MPFRLCTSSSRYYATNVKHAIDNACGLPLHPERISAPIICGHAFMHTKKIKKIKKNKYQEF
jgi:hypothetical protein